MARVALIPTGRMEWSALGPALDRIFPGHTFYAVPSADEIQSKPDMEFPLSSFTSVDVTRVTRVTGRPNNADKLIQRAAFEVMDQRADFAFILDDLELCNRLQASAVTQGVRDAVQRHLATLPTTTRNLQRRTQQALCEKVSFHLAKPMTEAWLFADPQGPHHAGASSSQQWHLLPNDPEDFETNDPNYAIADETPCTRWNKLNPARQKTHRPSWTKAGADRIYHPKAYLAWLTLDPTENSCTAYQETKGGAQALKDLNWSAVLTPHAAQAARMPFLTSLINDLADGLQQAPTIAPTTGALLGQEAPETGRTAALQSRHRCLRNL